MADSKTRKRRLRERRRHTGLKVELVWFTPAGQAAMAALRQPGETIDALFNGALITLRRLTQTGTRDRPHPDGRPNDAATAALVALLQVLLPEGKPRYLRDVGIATLPLAQLNAVLAPLGDVLVGTKTRSAARFVVCSDAYGQVERYGLFELRREEG